MLKRSQLLIEDWQVEYLRDDDLFLSLSETVRLDICISAIFTTSINSSVIECGISCAAQRPSLISV